MSETTTADGAADQARAKTQEVGAQAKEKAQEAGQQARERVRGEVDRRSTEAGEQAGSAAQALRDASQRLRQDGNEPVAKGMEQVAQRVESAGSWLRDSDGDRILREVEDFGRRNPLAVVAGGIALGFAASRVLKASSRRRFDESRQSWSGNGHGQRSRVGAPREGLTDNGVSGGTPATVPGPVATPVADRPPTTPPAPSSPAPTTPATSPLSAPAGATPPPPETGWRDPDVTP
jgi:cell division septation protein DedD